MVVVKVWDFETGRQVSEFIGCHGNASVTCLTFDSSGRRYALSLVSWTFQQGDLDRVIRAGVIIAVMKHFDQTLEEKRNHGHKEDILCVAQCPPCLLATSSYDGEIIVWNVVSGHMYCKLNAPSPVDGQDHGEGAAWRLLNKHPKAQWSFSRGIGEEDVIVYGKL
ncbi:hypothetical protein U0070_025113 [Myodes glareolus]|uniref:Uncharacterized protein n=1 Tax=Myodes glareolus TaxID=447135 RepID=A0AAW0I7S3_MYOGA